MTALHPLNQPQQIASAAEQFVRALTRLFPNGTFEQFFHADTVRHAFWAALQQAIEQYSVREDATPLKNGGGKSALLERPAVANELLKTFLPGQQPDYDAVAEEWAAALSRTTTGRADLVVTARTLFGLIVEAVDRSPELRLVLRQVGQARPAGTVEPGGADLNRLLEAALADGPGALHRQVRHLLA